MKEDLLEIINHYGIRPQLKQFNEETYELIEAINNYEQQKEACENIGCSRIHADKELEHVVEEIADVMVMIEQFRHYYNISSEEVSKIFWSKVNRQLERINNENK